MRPFMTTLLSLGVALIFGQGCRRDQPKSQVQALQAQATDSQNLVSGMSRWTPYGSEQGAWGTCKNFYDYSNDSKQWAAVSEKFAKERLGFRGCTSRGPYESPACQDAAFADGLCGRELQVRCTSSECQDKSWRKVFIVDVCPADRTYHDHADPDSRGDTACADKYVVDLDESLWYDVWSPGASRVNNVPIEISYGGTPPSDDSINDGESDSEDQSSDQNPSVGGYTCEQQKAWGKCGESWMHPVCSSVCNARSADSAEDVGSDPSDQPSDQPNNQPSDQPSDQNPSVGGYSCEQQKSWGKCGESWMHPVCSSVCNGSGANGGPGVWSDPYTGKQYPYCTSSSSDPDGDGWGWENQQSCKI